MEKILFITFQIYIIKNENESKSKVSNYFSMQPYAYTIVLLRINLSDP